MPFDHTIRAFDASNDEMHWCCKCLAMSHLAVQKEDLLCPMRDSDQRLNKNTAVADAQNLMYNY